MAFYAETETFGRYSYKFHSREIDPEDKHSSIMCFDFGGHNMNCCLFGVARDFNQQVDNSFFTVGKPSGVGGGSEQWEHHAGRWAVTRYFTKTRTLPNQEQLRKVFADFQAIKSQDEQNWGTTWYFDLPDGTAWRVPLSKETINDAWEKGLGRPLRLMERQLARLVTLQKKDRISSPLVMVSGGSARGPKARSCIEALCKEAGVDMIFTDEFLSVNYRTDRLSSRLRRK
ncbi:hypothetical protein B0T14DRAFT_209156 [Immersiella caudata]|uniref:Uncharacterized protein n=1 Tax=Immersiella caudata TaxID=314043 RepID=A0AA39WQ06_9PEZI|nr:hypothetical protein B0T14DRAFT_209156 [Immersiella caudata]